MLAGTKLIELAVPANLTLVLLPRSSELGPAQHVGEDIRENDRRNQVFSDPVEIMDSADGPAPSKGNPRYAAFDDRLPLDSQGCGSITLHLIAITNYSIAEAQRNLQGNENIRANGA